MLRPRPPARPALACHLAAALIRVLLASGARVGSSDDRPSGRRRPARIRHPRRPAARRDGPVPSGRRHSRHRPAWPHHGPLSRPGNRRAGASRPHRAAKPRRWQALPPGMAEHRATDARSISRTHVPATNGSSSPRLRRDADFSGSLTPQRGPAAPSTWEPIHSPGAGTVVLAPPRAPPLAR